MTLKEQLKEEELWDRKTLAKYLNIAEGKGLK